MSLIERLFGQKHHIARGGETEFLGGEDVQLWDLRNPEKAKERGVEPGYYFTVNPVSKREIDDPYILQKLSLSFHQKLQEAGLHKQSDTRIPIDTENSMFVDPSQGWLFSPTGYIPNLQMLVVKASQVDRDINQALKVKSLNKRR